MAYSQEEADLIKQLHAYQQRAEAAEALCRRREKALFEASHRHTELLNKMAKEYQAQIAALGALLKRMVVAEEPWAEEEVWFAIESTAAAAQAHDAAIRNEAFRDSMEIAAAECQREAVEVTNPDDEVYNQACEDCAARMAQLPAELCLTDRDKRKRAEEGGGE